LWHAAAVPRTRALVLAAALALPGAGARAERLPLRAYGTAEGLPSTDVQRTFCDSRGFLWFATRDGLARFDGARFVVYGTEQGLPVATVNDIIEARDGGYWVATNGGGACRLDAAAPFPGTAGAGAPPLFRCALLGEDALSSQVNVLLEDRSGTLWAGTDGGLFRRDGAGLFEKQALAPNRPRPPGISSLVEDATGTLWIGSARGLFQRRADGRIVRPGLPGEDDIVDVLLHDRQDRTWVGSRNRLTVFGPRGPAHSFGEQDGLPHGRLLRLRETTDGHIWAATTAGLAEYDGTRWRVFTRAHGLAHDIVRGLAEDHDGNLWVSTQSATMKLTRDGFVTYDEPQAVFALYEGSSGEVFAISGSWVISRFEGERLVSVRPVPPAADPGFAGQAAFLDRSGGWWLLSTVGVGRFAQVRRIEELDGRRAPQLYTPRDGVPGQRPRRLFEDARGDVWMGADGPVGVAGLARWSRALGRLEAFPQVHARPGDAPAAMNEDAAGGLWVGFLHDGLGRLFDGRFTLFPAAENGAPTGTVTAIHRDDLGRLWIGSNQQGLTLVEDPASEHPRFRRYTTANGLASNNVRCVVSDREGRIYAGTVHGVDRLDPASGRVRQFTTVDGLPNGFVTAAIRDGLGRLWFGTQSGLARLLPVARDRRAPAPRVWIGAVRIGGSAQSLPNVGASAVHGLRVEPERNQVQIEFFSVGFAAGETLSFQQRLDGAGEWSPPSQERAIQFSALGPGRHLVQVRAINADGVPSAQPALVELTVLPTLWQRGSVRALLGLLGAAALYAVHRYRLRHALALERVRTRIASDLHDDIGASLSQISILTELARRELPPGAGPAGPLDRIAESSRELVDAMSDIVWAVDPRRDRLGDLFHRMRRFASDTLAARDIELRFLAPEREGGRVLGADARRQVLLIFKEAVNNVARHAACRSASVAIALEDGWLSVGLSDDGRGFDPDAASDGHGLHSMRQRARALGGTLEIHSAAGRGTRLQLRAPLEGR
jgi:ligand-binding sensor domain-containing protein/signal transduction histidine kinase